MKLGAITDEISMDFAHALDVMKEYECYGAELRTLWNVNIGDLSDSQLDEALQIVEKKKFEVSCIASPLYKCDIESNEATEAGPLHQANKRSLAEQMDLLKRCTKIAKMFGTKYIRIFSFWRQGELTPAIENEIIKKLADGVKYAEDNDIVLLMENEYACFLGTGEETARIVKKINSPALQAVWDPGNAIGAGENPFPTGYEAIRNYTKHVHVKDAETLAGGKQRFVVVGEGEIDYKGQLTALKNDGYDGYISLETHYRPFAGTAEQASRLCLQSLRALLSE